MGIASACVGFIDFYKREGDIWEFGEIYIVGTQRVSQEARHCSADSH